jgi:ACS family hexuronate transporter-like MFS transporter
MNAETARPTKVVPPARRRYAADWLPTATMTLLSLLSYVDRNALALLANTIRDETGLNAEQYGWIISAFSAGYLIGNPFWGRVLDRFGVRAGLVAAVSIWTLASASHAFATTLLAFAMARAILGFGEGATFPGGLLTATKTLALHARGRGIALAYSGASLGAIVTPILVTPIALRWGWRGAFLCTGVLGVAWLVLWTFVARDPRLRGPAVTQAISLNGPRLRLGPAVWGFMAAYAFGGLPIGFVTYGAPIHLGRALGCDQATLGRVLWIPPLGWEIGYLFWGWVVDRAARRRTLAGHAFARPFGLLAVLALPLAAAPLLHARAAVLALLFFAMFISAGFVIASLSETTRRHAGMHGATIAGLGAGAWSGLMALAMPVFGRLFDRGAYGAAYAIAAVSPLVGYFVWDAFGRGLAVGSGEPQ